MRPLCPACLCKLAPSLVLRAAICHCCWCCTALSSIQLIVLAVVSQTATWHGSGGSWFDPARCACCMHADVALHADMAQVRVGLYSRDGDVAAQGAEERAVETVLSHPQWQCTFNTPLPTFNFMGNVRAHSAVAVVCVCGRACCWCACVYSCEE